MQVSSKSCFSSREISWIAVIAKKGKLVRLWPLLLRGGFELGQEINYSPKLRRRFFPLLRRGKMSEGQMGEDSSAYMLTFG